MSNSLPHIAASAVRGARVVVALSGGRDSVTLLHALVRGGADVRAAHVDHGLRADSANDVRFCAKFAGGLRVPFASTRLEIRPGNSTLGRARTQRYAALVRMACELGGDVLAVAHHANDASESIQLLAERGARGGAGGPQARSDWWGFPVARPFLDTPRAVIDDYASAHDLPWLEDPSNVDPRFARARLRLRGPQLDLEATRATQRRAAELAGLVNDVPAETRAPHRIAFARNQLASLDDELLGQLFLVSARTLHGELPGEVVGALTRATRGDGTEAQRFCGRRIVVIVTRGQVSVEASRGQATRLIDARRTPTLPLGADADYPWFDRRIVVRRTRDAATAVALAPHADLVLRGPLAGDRMAGSGAPILDLLADAGVDQAARWRWPCIYRGDAGVVVCGHAVAPVPDFFLPPDDISGIFIRWEPLLCVA